MIPMLLLALALAPQAAGDNWPRFRGPSGQGLSEDAKVPTAWTATTNVLWKTAIPGEGWSSPIVWGDRVFVTSTLEGGTSCHVLCLDAVSGRILWDTHVFDQPAERKEGKNSYATPTPCTDGERVYA